MGWFIAMVVANVLLLVTQTLAVRPRWRNSPRVRLGLSVATIVLCLTMGLCAVMVIRQLLGL